jgi:putative alpha-1,2-mannosidase
MTTVNLCSLIDHISVSEAQPGYFSLGLASMIKAELTVTSHVALHRYTYSNTSSTVPATLLLDLTNDLSHSFSGDGQLSISAVQKTTTATAAGSVVRVTGGGRFIPSFGLGNYKVSGMDTFGVSKC